MTRQLEVMVRGAVRVSDQSGGEQGWTWGVVIGWVLDVTRGDGGTLTQMLNHKRDVGL